MGFQLSYFKFWKMMLWKCCTQYASKFGKLSSGHRTGKDQFSLQSQRKAMPIDVQTTTQVHSSHTLMLKILQSQIFKLDWAKTEVPEIKLPTLMDHRESKRVSEEYLLPFYAKTFNSVDHNKLWKILKELKYQTTLPVSWETCIQDKKWQLEPDLEQLTGSKLGKEDDKADIVTLLI